MCDEPRSLCECHDCGLLQRLPTGGDTRVVCARCKATLRRQRTTPQAAMLGTACLGLWALCLALFSSLATVFMSGGRTASADIADGSATFRQSGFWELSFVVLSTLVVLPALELGAVMSMAVARWRRRFPRWVRRWYAALPTLAAWSMVDVFLLGAMVALLRLQGWMHVEFGLALFALVVVAVCCLTIEYGMERHEPWSRVPFSPSVHQAQQLRSCDACQLVLKAREGGVCPRCGSTLRSRKRQSLTRTTALVIAGTLLCVPANVLPVMTVVEAGRGGPSTILGGAAELAHHGYWPLAVLVFIASIAIPLLKLLALAVLLFATARGSRAHLLLRTRIYRVVAKVGRWSMLDIYATMMLAALASFGWLGRVVPEAGASAFCAVVVVTMLAAEAFDPRLMWDANEQPRVNAA